MWSLPTPPRVEAARAAKAAVRVVTARVVATLQSAPRDVLSQKSALRARPRVHALSADRVVKVVLVLSADPEATDRLARPDPRVRDALSVRVARLLLR